MTTIVIELPEELKSLAKPMQELVVEVERARQGALSGSRAVQYADIEARFARAAREIESAAHQVTLQALDIDEPQLEIDGKRYSRVVRTNGTFKAMSGEVAVVHSRYRRDGERNGLTVDTITLRTGTIGDGWLPATAAAMAHAVQQAPSREAAAHAARTFRFPYSRSAFEDVAHAVGAQVCARRAEVEDELIRRVEVPRHARSVSVSLDRVTVPMEEPRPRPVGRPPRDAPAHPIARVYRMGYVGTVSLHDEHGDAIHTIRYGRMPDGDIEGMMRALEEDTRALLEKRPDLEVVLLADGAAEMWERLDSAISESALGTRVTRILDFWHVTEKLAAALRVLDGNEHPLARWKLLLLNRADAVDEILAALRASGKRDTRVGDARPVHDAITYLENHRDLMRYTTARRRHLPIGSGIAEATCKSLFNLRMKRPGSRWKTATGDHILHLRALALSDRWDPAVHLSLAHLRKPVRRLPLAA